MASLARRTILKPWQGHNARLLAQQVRTAAGATNNPAPAPPIRVLPVEVPPPEPGAACVPVVRPPRLNAAKSARAAARAVPAPAEPEGGKELPMHRRVLRYLEALPQDAVLPTNWRIAEALGTTETNMQGAFNRLRLLELITMEGAGNFRVMTLPSGRRLSNRDSVPA